MRLKRATARFSAEGEKRFSMSLIILQSVVAQMRGRRGLESTATPQEPARRYRKLHTREFSSMEVGEAGAVIITAGSPPSLKPSRLAVQTLLETAARKCSIISPTKRKIAAVSPTS